MRTILQFVADGDAGGGTTVVLSLVTGMIDAGWRVVVLTDANPKAGDSSYAADRARELGAEVITADFMSSRTDPRALTAVEDAVRATKPDVVHLHGTRAMFFARKVEHRAMMATIHGYHHLRKGFVGRLVGGLGLKQSFGAIRDLIFVSDYDRRSGVQHGLIPPRATAHVIHNGIDLPKVELGPRDLRRIAFPHRLTFPKDPITAIKALLLLDGYTMEIAGAGELDGAAQSYALETKALTLHGGLSRERTLQLIGESGVMLMTSLWEGLPMTPLESMALGTPVVAPAVCGIPEIFDDGIDGILVHEHSPEAYAAAIRRLEDDELRASMVVKAKAKVEAEFTWKLCFAKHFELYESRAAA